MKELEDMLRLARRHAGQPLALATIVRTQGSSYRAVGTRMLIAPDGSSVGALSGGCLEEDIVTRAAAVIATGTPVLVPYDTRRLFGCDGCIEVFIERVQGDGAWAQALERCFATRERGAMLTVFEGAERERLGSYPVSLLDAVPDGALLHMIEPPVHLVIAGGGQDAVPLVGLGRSLGWRVTVLARPEQNCNAFGDAEILPVTAPDEWPMPADSRTAAVIMTHQFGRDAAFLRQMVQLPFGYLGLLGPRRRRERLLEAIGDAADVAALKLHNPAGLDVGAETPEEVALAIVAEIQAVMTNSHAGFLRDRKGPIHARSEEAMVR
ncbi:MAG: XdhC family protein [Chthoniobacterales bacterium]|nr:XdhC family protein [Chthoniobacterales bacterium]